MISFSAQNWGVHSKVKAEQILPLLQKAKVAQKIKVLACPSEQFFSCKQVKVFPVGKALTHPPFLAVFLCLQVNKCQLCRENRVLPESPRVKRLGMGRLGV